VYLYFPRYDRFVTFPVSLFRTIFAPSTVVIATHGKQSEVIDSGSDGEADIPRTYPRALR
jgi:hypothetical protein